VGAGVGAGVGEGERDGGRWRRGLNNKQGECM